MRPQQYLLSLPLLAVAALLFTLALLSGCGTSASSSSAPPPTSGGGGSSDCPSVMLQEALGPSTGTAPLPDPAPVPPPNPGSTSSGSVCVSTPANGATVNSPAHIVASASLKSRIKYMRVYVDGTPTLFTFFNSIDQHLWMADGAHNVEVLATDDQGNNVSTTFSVNVAPPATQSITNIQNMSGWEPCTDLFDPGHPRAGQICAAGLGPATASLTQDQSSPSLSGSSAKFSLTGGHIYSNELWTQWLGGGTNTTHFIYDLYFYVDNPSVTQALEFDVNQSFGGQRWVYGTECNLRADGVWDVWDGRPGYGWTPTKVPCTGFPANTWIHLVWTFERVGDQVHYISVQVGDTVYPVDQYQSNEPVWPMEDISVAFQMDDDYAAQPYNVWLDNVTLTTY
ncbi:MAG TPA: Ig-like domain-containing protein [candidate division Zixibacteria bacterium]|nr:Ig-like domain-containing protein [candidate division Zixibacteria bacterium]